MGSINKRGERYRALIRKKGNTLSATFSNRETAEIWVRYQEDLIDEMENFQAPPEALITLRQAIELKKEDFIENGVSKRSIEDLDIIVREFEEFLDFGLNGITPDMLREKSKEMLSGISRKGGNQKNLEGGLLTQTSPATVLRKFRVLSAVFGFMIQKGANLINPAQVVCNQVKMSMIKKGIKEEDG